PSHSRRGTRPSPRPRPPHLLSPRDTGTVTPALGPMEGRITDLSGRVAVVTGGGTGIGAATVRLLAGCGASVVLAARSADRLERVASSTERDTGARCLAVVTDVREEDQCAALVSRTIDEFGRIDVLVNNAGGARLTQLETTS